MRRFSFTLESVLTIKQKNLEDERIKLARAMNLYNQQKELLENIIQSLKDLTQEADKYAQGSNIDLELMSSFRKYSIKLTSDIQAQKVTVQKAYENMVAQQMLAQEAYKEVKTLEKLKEKQKENYLKELQDEEIKTIDDIVSSRRVTNYI